MSPREQLVDMLLPVLKEFCPDASGSDLSFFGYAADVSSPLQRKYGVDITEDIVYNIKTVSVCGEPLFGEIWVEGGFLNLNMTDRALEMLASEAAKKASAPPSDVIPLGRTPEYLHAALLSIAERDKGLPAETDGTVRRALRFALMADTSSRRRLCLDPIASALAAHRRGEARISAVQARAMAFCLEKMITGS